MARTKQESGACSRKRLSPHRNPPLDPHSDGNLSKPRGARKLKLARDSRSAIDKRAAAKNGASHRTCAPARAPACAGARRRAGVAASARRMKRRVTFGHVEIYKIPNRADADEETPDWLLYASSDEDGVDEVAVYEDDEDDAEARMADCQITNNIAIAKVNRYRNRMGSAYALDSDPRVAWRIAQRKHSPRLMGVHGE